MAERVGAELASIEIEGELIESVKRPFKRNGVDADIVVQAGIELVACDACSGCANAMASFMAALVRAGTLETMRDTIFLYGQSVKELPPERTAS